MKNLKKTLVILIISLFFINTNAIAQNYPCNTVAFVEMKYGFVKYINTNYNITKDMCENHLTSKNDDYIIQFKNINNFDVSVTYFVRNSKNMQSSCLSGAIVIPAGKCANIIIYRKGDDYDEGYVEFTAWKQTN